MFINEVNIVVDDYEYFKAAKRLKVDLKKAIPNWEEYRQRKGAKAITEKLGFNEK